MQPTTGHPLIQKQEPLIKPDAIFSA